MSPRSVTPILLAALILTACAHAQDTLVIKAGLILTMAGPPIERGMVVVTSGRISYVGPAQAVPAGATVIEAPVVMPGLVDANPQYGRRGDANEQISELTPSFSPSAALDPAGAALQRALQLGVTTARVAAGNDNVIAGHATVIKTGGLCLGDCAIREGGEVKFVLGHEAATGNRTPRSGRPDSFYYRQPTTSMGVVWILRQALADVQSALEHHEKLTPDQELLAEVLRGKVTVHMALRSAVDVETAFTIADEFGLKRLVFEDCTEGYKLAGDIAQRKVPAILGPMYTYPTDYLQSMEGKDLSWNNAGLLARAGVPVAIASNQSTPADLLLWATWAARNGLPRELALKAVTSTPAEIIGVADRVGSIVKGKDADLLILSGDPLAATTRLDTVIINGRIAWRSPTADAGSESNEKH